MNVVSEALFQTQMETLNAFLKFLPEQYGEDVDMDFMNEVVTAFQKKLKADHGNGVETVVVSSTKKSKKSTKKGSLSSSDDSDSSTGKKKRAPSAYNHFIKYKCAILKKEGDIASKELMMAASSAWKELDEDKKKEFTAVLKENPDITCKELYERVMEEEHDDITMEDLEAPKTKKKAAPKKTDKKTAKKMDEDKSKVTDNESGDDQEGDDQEDDDQDSDEDEQDQSPVPTKPKKNTKK